MQFLKFSATGLKVKRYWESLISILFKPDGSQNIRTPHLTNHGSHNRILQIGNTVALA